MDKYVLERSERGQLKVLAAFGSKLLTVSWLELCAEIKAKIISDIAAKGFRGINLGSILKVRSLFHDDREEFSKQLIEITISDTPTHLTALK